MPGTKALRSRYMFTHNDLRPRPCNAVFDRSGRKLGPFSWSDQLDRRKVSFESARIAGENSEACDLGMCADVKVWHRRGSRAALSAVFQERPSRKKCSRERKRLTPVKVRGKPCIQFLDPLKTRRDLGINDRVDHNCRIVHCGFQCGRRPFEPTSVAR